MSKIREIGNEWHRTILEDPGIPNSLRVPYLLIYQAVKVLIRREDDSGDVSIEVPSGQMRMKGFPPTVDVSQKTRIVGDAHQQLPSLSQSAQGTVTPPTLIKRARILSNKYFQYWLYGAVVLALVLIFVPGFIDASEGWQKLIDPLPEIGLGVFAAILGLLLGRASGGSDPKK